MKKISTLILLVISICASANDPAHFTKKSIGGSPNKLSSAENLIITKTSDKPVYAPNSPAIFTITIENPDALNVVLDRIVDELPAGFTFVSINAGSDVNEFNSTAVPSAGATGTITFEGGVVGGNSYSYFVPAGGVIVLIYTATTCSFPASNLLTTVEPFIGSTSAGSAQNTVSVSVILPVTFISLKASPVGNYTEIEWLTADEINVQSYQLERKTGNGEFTAVTEINANGVAGATNRYTWIDPSTQSGTYYYRVKIIDIDAKQSYSKTVKYTKGWAGDILLQQVYPNPVTDNATIHFYSGAAQIVQLRLFNMLGSEILRTQIDSKKGSNDFVLTNLGELAPSVYMIELRTGNSSVFQKILKAGL